MRVLFTTYSQRTHLFSMVPMAWALRTAGHDVRFACQPKFAQEVTQAGLTAVPVGRGDTSWHRLAEVHPDLSEPGLPAPYDTAVMQPSRWSPSRPSQRTSKCSFESTTIPAGRLSTKARYQHGRTKRAGWPAQSTRGSPTASSGSVASSAPTTANQ